MVNKIIKCPNCGQEIELKPQDGNPAKLIAYCYCGGRNLRAVYLTDVPIPAFSAPSVKSDKKKEY